MLLNLAMKEKQDALTTTIEVKVKEILEEKVMATILVLEKEAISNHFIKEEWK